MICINRSLQAGLGNFSTNLNVPQIQGRLGKSCSLGILSAVLCDVFVLLVTFFLKMAKQHFNSPSVLPRID